MSSAGVEGDAAGGSVLPAAGGPRARPDVPVSEVGVPGLDELVREVAATLQQVTIVRHALAGWVRARGLPAGMGQDVLLAATEAMANVVDHAYPHDPDGTLVLTATAAPGLLALAVTDTGRWKDAPSQSCRGRGIAIMRAVSAETVITTSPAGTTVRLTWSWAPPA